MSFSMRDLADSLGSVGKAFDPSNLWAGTPKWNPFEKESSESSGPPASKPAPLSEPNNDPNGEGPSPYSDGGTVPPTTGPRYASLMQRLRGMR